MLCPDSVHPQLNLCPLRADLHDSLTQLHLLFLRFANALLQCEEGIKSNGL